MIDMEEGDHNDLSSIMNLVDKRDIPPNMVCLWDNQQQVLNARERPDSGGIQSKIHSEIFS